MAATLVRDLRANLTLGMDDDEFNKGMAGLEAKAPKQGEAVAGAFSKAFSRQLGQAFRSLPQAQIGADTSEADLKVNVLKQSLRDLANKRIGVDIDSATALGEMRAIKEQLEGLKDTADIAVKADITKALAALGVIEHEVEKLDGKSVDIDVDIQGAPAAVAKLGLIDSALSVMEASGPLKVAAIGGAIALLPTAAAAAGVAMTAILGGALAGIGLAASQGSAVAQAALARLKVAAQQEAQEVGKPFEKVWVTIVDTAQRELSTLGPHVRDSLADLAPTVQEFVTQAGGSLEELTPAVDSVERAFKVLLQSLGPAMPGIMRDLADGITSIADAVGENPEVLTRMAQGLAGFVDWAGKATAKLIQFAKVMQDNGDAIRTLFGAMNLPLQTLNRLGFGLVDTSKHADQMTEATQNTAEGASVLDQQLVGLANAFGLVGPEAATSAQQLVTSWSQAFQSMTSVSSVMQRVEATTQATIAQQERQAQAQRQLADAQANAAERMAQAKRRLADVEESAAERIESADRGLVDAKQRAADEVAAANARVADSRQAVTDAEEQAAEREADAAGRVEDARRKAAQQAEDSSRRIEDAVQRVSDAEQAAADHEADSSRRVQDAHERTMQAVDDLTEARKRAKQELEDLAASEADSALDVEAAQLAVARAAQRRQDVFDNPDSPALDRQEADLAYRQAVQRLEDVKKRDADLHKQIQDATAAGVEGAAAVVSAAARVAQAQQAEVDAQAAAAKQRLSDIRAISDAERALADAQREAAQQQEDAQRAIASAEADLNRARVEGAREVADAKKAEADAVAAAAKTSTDAARQVADAQASAAKAHKDAARDIQDAEAAVTKARQDSAKEIERASQAVRDAMSGVGTQAHVTTEQFLAELDRQVKNTEDWAKNLESLAGRVPAAMVERLRALGPGSADVIAMAAHMTDDQLRRFIDLMARSGATAGDAFADALARQVSKNAITVNINTSYGGGHPLAEGGIVFANGAVLSGPVRRFASGTERHVAQISAPGTRIWSEPETEGEGYIPLALSKRARSEAILSDIADRFGGMYVKPQSPASMPVMGGDGASGAWGGAIAVGPITLQFADDRDMYSKGQEFAAGLREYVRRGGVLPS